MERFEAFKPHAENRRAVEEEKERQNLDFHNRGLHDEAPEERIDEATGKLLKPSASAGTGEKLSGREVSKKDKSEDALGSVPGALPDDAAKLQRWMEKEKERLEKKRGGGFKKAA